MKIIESNLAFRNALDRRNRTDIIVLHHAEATECTIYDIHEWHLGNSWSGCGYHYFVRKNGSIYRGRPEDKVGAQCKGHNSHTIGICLEGNYMKEIVPQKQLKATIELCNMLNKKYGKLEIRGHGELVATDCPGTNFPLEEIKSKVRKNAMTEKLELNILELQQFLNSQNVRDYENKVLVEDGQSGVRTQTAVLNLIKKL